MESVDTTYQESLVGQKKLYKKSCPTVIFLTNCKLYSTNADASTFLNFPPSTAPLTYTPPEALWPTSSRKDHLAGVKFSLFTASCIGIVPAINLETQVLSI